MKRMPVIAEEVNIILSALRLVADGSRELAEATPGMTAGQRHANTFNACINLSDRIEKHGIENISLTVSEFNLVVTVLRNAAGGKTIAGQQLRQQGNRPAANMAEQYADGCRAVADKWERYGPNAIISAAAH